MNDAARRYIIEHHEPWEWPVKPPRKRRRLSLARAITRAQKAGVDVTVMPDGSITLRTGSTGFFENPVEQITDNETPETLRKLIQ
jgi:hypothetical protein